MLYALLVVAALLLAHCAFAAPPAVNLSLPEDGNLTTESTMAFFCNASSDDNITEIDFFSDFGGFFSLNGYKVIGTFDSDADTTMLCHFDGDYSCEEGEEGINFSTSFVSGRFEGAVSVNETDTLRYPVSGKLSPDRGSVEVWIKPVSDPTSEFSMIFDSGSHDFNRIELFNSNGLLSFRLIDAFEGVSYSEADISSWNIGEWHYLSAVWDTSGLDSGYVTDLFIDGSDGGTSSSDDFTRIDSLGQYLYIGSDIDGQNQGDSVFDELRLSAIARQDTEPNDYYSFAQSGHTYAAVNFTVNGIADGTYIWNCMAHDNNSLVAWAASNFTLNVDVSAPPAVDSLILSPEPEDDMDPGVWVNASANITSISGISTVILQYKYDLDWINLTMSNTSRESWNASFQTISSERVYQYRIFANDTLGHSMLSPVYTRNVTWDYSWLRTPQNMTAYGRVSTVGDVGVLVINNTGDDTLTITLSDDWPIVDVYYNTTSQFSVPAKESRYVNITAKFAEVDSSSIMTINISAQTSAPGKYAYPISVPTSVTMNSYTGGPYLDITLDSFPANVNQSQAGIFLGAVIRNIGNETAGNVSLVWSLPQGWLNTTGGVYQEIGDILQQASNRSNVTIYVNASAVSRMESICVNVTREPGVAYTKCQNIAVSCTSGDGVCGAGCAYTNDHDCQVTASSGGVSQQAVPSFVGGASPFSGHGLVITGTPMADALRNETAHMTIYVRSLGNRTVVNNLRLYVSGYPASQVMISPDSVHNVTSEERAFLVDVHVPEYARYGPLNISIIAMGDSMRIGYRENATPVNGTHQIVIFVHSEDENRTLEAYSQALEAVQGMTLAGMNTEYVADMLSQANESISKFDYASALSLSETILETSKSAFDARAAIDEIFSRLEESESYGLVSNQTRKLYELAVSAFVRGDYKRAGERASSAFLAYNIELGDRTMLAEMIDRNWKLALSSVALVLLLAAIMYRNASVRARARRLSLLKKDEKSVSAMLVSLQKDFFEKRGMSRQRYEIEKNVFEKKLAYLRKQISSVESGAGGFFSFGKAVKGENLSGRVRELQRDYFEKRKISRGIYEKSIRELRKEEQEPLRRNRKRFIFLALMLTGILFPANAFCTEITYGDFSDASHASQSISEAETRMHDLYGLGFSTARINDTLAEARKMMASGNYQSATASAVYAQSIMDDAVAADNLLDAAESRLQEASGMGIDTSYAEDLFARGLDAFDSEIYEDAKSYFQRAYDYIDDEQKNRLVESAYSSSIGEQIYNTLNESRFLIAGFAAASLVILIASFMFRGILFRRREISELRKEKYRAEDEMKKVQGLYFIKGAMPRSQYLLVMRSLRKRIDEAVEKLLVSGNANARAGKQNKD